MGEGLKECQRAEGRGGLEKMLAVLPQPLKRGMFKFILKRNLVKNLMESFLAEEVADWLRSTTCVHHCAAQRALCFHRAARAARAYLHMYLALTRSSVLRLVGSPAAG